jgi:hypothetical protein
LRRSVEAGVRRDAPGRVARAVGAAARERAAAASATERARDVAATSRARTASSHAVAATGCACRCARSAGSDRHGDPGSTRASAQAEAVAAQGAARLSVRRDPVRRRGQLHRRRPLQLQALTAREALARRPLSTMRATIAYVIDCGFLVFDLWNDLA